MGRRSGSVCGDGFRAGTFCSGSEGMMASPLTRFRRWWNDSPEPFTLDDLRGPLRPTAPRRPDFPVLCPGSDRPVVGITEWPTRSPDVLVAVDDAVCPVCGLGPIKVYALTFDAGFFGRGRSYHSSLELHEVDSEGRGVNYLALTREAAGYEPGDALRFVPGGPDDSTQH